MLTLLFNSVYKYKHSHLYLAFQFICKQTHMCMFVSTYRYIKLRQICGKFGKLCCPILAFVIMLTRTKVTLTCQFYFRVYQWCINLIYISTHTHARTHTHIHTQIYIYIYKTIIVYTCIHIMVTLFHYLPISCLYMCIIYKHI